MTYRNSGYMNDVDRLVEQTSLATVLQEYGLPLPAEGGSEHRMNCVFNECCSDSTYGNLTVKLNDPANRVYCHTCGVRGNLLTLIHGLETHKPPSGDRLRGEEFKQAVARLRAIAQVSSDTRAKVVTAIAPSPIPASSKTVERPVNVPLHKHEKEAARALANLHDDLIHDVGEMSPEAAQYVRHRPWMTPDILRKWGVGWIPGNGRSLFRKNYLVYTHRNERGEIVSYSGRDLSFEEKWAKWMRNGKPEGKKPGKHRYVSGYHRGADVYGGQATRIQEEYVPKSLERIGLVVVEGMNEVLRLDASEVAAVGLGSNKATETQIRKLVRFARQAAQNRVLLLPDCDEEGERGFKELLWRLAENDVDTRLGWSSGMFERRFAGRQPESLTKDELEGVLAHASRR